MTKERSETRDLPIFTRSAPVRGFDEASRTFDVVWTTGATVRRYDYYRERAYDEVLSLEPDHVRMGRFEKGVPLLDSHMAWNLRSVLGRANSPALTADEGTAKAKFSKRKDAEEIAEDVRDGIITDISVGYRVHKFEMEPPARGSTVWTYRATDWEPHEISLVPIGADQGAGVRTKEMDPFDGKRSAACEFFNPAESSAITQESNMLRSFIAPLGLTVDEGADDAAVRSAVVAHFGLSADATDEQIVAAAVRKAPTAEAPADAVAEAYVAATKAEQGRAASIITLCAKHGGDAEFQARALKEGWSAERTGLEILNVRAAKGDANPINTAPVPGADRADPWAHTIRKFGGK